MERRNFGKFHNANNYSNNNYEEKIKSLSESLENEKKLR